MLKKATASLNPAARAAALGIAAFVASLSAVCRADTFTFPAEGTDIASAADWGGTLPGTTDIAMFTSSKTVTASNDFEFAGLYIGAQNTTLTFDMRNAVSGGSPRKIAINGNACAYDGSNANIWNVRYTLRGGRWDFGNYTVGINPPDKYNGPDGCSLTIDGDAVVTCGQLLGAATGSSRSANMRIDGEGTVVTSATLMVANYGGYNNTMTIANGATVVLTGTSENALVVDYGKGNCNSLIVTNGASLTKLSGDKKIIVGRQGMANRMVVYGGSSAQIAGSVYFGHDDNANANTASDNAIVVCGTGARLSMGTTYNGNANRVAASAGSSNNVATIADGGSVTCGRWYFYGHDNGIVVSNGTMTLTSIKSETSTNCFIRLQGEHPSFVSNGGSGEYSEFKDGFRLCYDLSAEGYGADEWPYAMSNPAKFMDDTVSVEVTGIQEVRARMKADGIERKTVNLAKFTDGFATGYGITDAMLERWNASLPEGAKLALADNKLTLDIRAKAPTVVSLR